MFAIEVCSGAYLQSLRYRKFEFHLMDLILLIPLAAELLKAERQCLETKRISAELAWSLIGFCLKLYGVRIDILT